MSTTLHIAISNASLLRILILGVFGFLISTIITPLYTTLAYRGQWWKKQRTEAWSGGTATVYNKLHAEKHKRHIPTMAGIIFVVSIAVVTLAGNLNRGQTWLPLVGMIASGAVGLVDDWLNIRSNGKGIAGMRAILKLVLHSIIAVVAGWWFYSKLGVHGVYVPGLHEITIGAFLILLFWFVVIATANSVNITDGLDGLAGVCWCRHF